VIGPAAPCRASDRESQRRSLEPPRPSARFSRQSPQTPEFPHRYRQTKLQQLHRGSAGGSARRARGPYGRGTASGARGPGTMSRWSRGVSSTSRGERGRRCAPSDSLERVTVVHAPALPAIAWHRHRESCEVRGRASRAWSSIKLRTIPANAGGGARVSNRTPRLVSVRGWTWKRRLAAHVDHSHERNHRGSSAKWGTLPAPQVNNRHSRWGAASSCGVGRRERRRGSGHSADSRRAMDDCAGVSSRRFREAFRRRLG